MSDNGNPSVPVEPQRSIDLLRIYSHLDDQSVCHDHHNEMQASTWNTSTSRKSLSLKGDTETELSEKPRSSDDSREGQDLEQGLAIEKSRTPGSIEDPNIVSLPPGLQCFHHYTLLICWRLTGDVERSR